MQIDQFCQMLDEFKNLSSPIKSPTFMEIAGYPHYENVCSNILAFYFQPDASHGLSDLCLKALLSLASDYEPQSNVTVEREVTTEKGNRIDIVIRSDTHLIGIENKIYHSVENPLEDYADFLQKKRSHRTLVKFLLSLYPEGDQDLHGFIPIRYSALFTKLRPLIGDYVGGANPKFLILFTDFIETIENLTRGSAMDQSTITLFHERGSEITAMLGEVRKFKAEMRQKTSELANLINKDNSMGIKRWYYRKEQMLFDDLIYDISLPDDFICSIDCIVSAEGWRILAWARRGNFEQARSLFNTLQIPFKEIFSDGKRLEHPTRYPYNEPIITIQAIVQDWIDRIVSVQNS